MEDGSKIHGFAFPELYERWKNHDLAYHDDLGSIRPWFYERLKPEDEPRVWRFIEENYLLRYENFMAVRFEWSSSGLWKIPFPGSVGYGWHTEPEDIGLPGRARDLLREWHDPLDDPRRLDDDDYFDYEASDEKGLAAAKQVKLFLGEKVYLEFHPFREIAISPDGEATETEVPEFISHFADGA